MSTTIPTFKLCVIGDGGVGKTTWVRRHTDGTFEKKYIATMGVEVYPLTFYLASQKPGGYQGRIKFNIWDCAGQEKLGGLRDDYYIQADAAIVMFDLTQQTTFNNAMSWHTSFLRVNPSKANNVVWCGNKVDIKGRKVTAEMLTSIPHQVKYFDISAKSCYNFEKPFLQLARTLMNDETLNCVESPELIVPPTIDFQILNKL
jgi:GTP-binding nuclear protein Ran